MDALTEKLAAMPGKVGFYYKNLITGETIEFNSHKPVRAASVIKLFVMAEAFRQIEEGLLNPNDIFTVNKAECVPSCGALVYMHDGLKVTVRDLITLMIILSDNSATNFLVDLLGIDNINKTIRSLGYKDTSIGRKMFDSEKAALGIQNYICAAETADLLERIYSGTLIGKEASEQMLGIMLNQRLNGKIPFYLHALENSPKIAHKTGEDDGTTHDAAIVFAPEPFILVFVSNETDVPAYERLMQDTAFELYQAQL